MDSAEAQELRALTRDFVEGEVRPVAGEWDARRGAGKEILAQLGEMGFLVGRVPEEAGGLGLDLPSWLGVVEELARGDAGLALAVGLHGGVIAELVERLAGEAQREEWMPPLASGSRLGFLGLWEEEGEGGHPDPDGWVTTARREGDVWRIRGKKRWIVGSPDTPGVVLLFAAGEPETTPGVGGGTPPLHAFLFSTDHPGWTVPGREDSMGLRSFPIGEAEVELLLPDSARLPLDPAAVGGRTAVRHALLLSRLVTAAMAVGVAQSAYEHAVEYSGERRQFDVPLSELGAIRSKLAGMARRVAAARALLMEVAREANGLLTPAAAPGSDGTPPLARAALARITASEAAMWVTDEAVQVFGGYGYMRHYPVEKLMRDAKGAGVCLESDERLESLVARAVLQGGLDSGARG